MGLADRELLLELLLCGAFAHEPHLAPGVACGVWIVDCGVSCVVPNANVSDTHFKGVRVLGLADRELLLEVLFRGAFARQALLLVLFLLPRLFRVSKSQLPLKIVNLLFTVTN